MKPRVRFAPSPTGFLHVGGARTALFNWLFARHHEGDFILRIEDTDQSRSTEESIRQITESMEWLGLTWDEYYRQTERNELHQDYARNLKESDKVYESEGAWWFSVPETGQTVFRDEIMGEVSYDHEELKDFVIRRSDGTFTYNFACMVDDHEMNISHVMRGDDHLNNTPKQILLYDAVDVEPPTFAHFPMILGEDETRLSKRHGATSVLRYREQGYLPEALVNFLARLGWSSGDQETFRREELVNLFDLSNVGSSPAIFDDEKLLWLNHYWLKQKDPEELGQLLETYLLNEGIIDDSHRRQLDPQRLTRAAELIRKRNKTLVDMARASAFAFVKELDKDQSLIDKHFDDQVRNLLPELGNWLQRIEAVEFTAERIEQICREFVEEKGISLGDIGQPCRVAVTGREVSPGLFETMELPGKDRTVRRLVSVNEN